jgi:hypothetical protein
MKRNLKSKELTNRLVVVLRWRFLQGFCVDVYNFIQLCCVLFCFIVLVEVFF